MTEKARFGADVAIELERFGSAAVGDVPPARWAFREAAAVLAWFDPPNLRPVGEAFAKESPLTWILADSERVVGEDGLLHWALEDSIRRQTLRRLETREAMKRALDANSDRPRAAIQKAFEALVRGESVDPDVPEGELLEAVEWVDGILDGLPAPNELRRQAGLTRFLRPLRFLVGSNFQGRESVLQRLRDHVGVLPAHEAAAGTVESIVRHGVRFARRLRSSLSEWPPLFIWGPGGVGKSTVIAKFVLDHAAVDEENRFPFVFLNFDRAGLVPEEPLTLLREAAREIGIQYPEVLSRADSLRTAITEAMGARGGPLSEAVLDRGGFLRGFRKLVEKAEPRERPLLLVLDTFEEVEYLGRDRVEIVWDFLEELQNHLPQLCTVVAGRNKPQKLTAEPVYLGPFGEEAAAAFVNGLLQKAKEAPLEPDEMETLLDGIGTVPLSLKLAVGLLIKDRQEGGQSLGKIETHHTLFGFRVLRAKAASIQGQLYGRILEHIHDEEVKKLAFPGLALRRVTPPLIREVLAVPCAVEVRDDEHAEELYGKLAREATLVEERDGALVHRVDVRRLMLEDLRSQYPKQTLDIHERAVSFYAERSGEDNVRDRAEEIYHLLCLDRPHEDIDARWIPGVEPHLKSALEELAPSPGLYLAKRLGVTIDKKLQADADLQDWEKMAVASAQRHLALQDPELALKVLRERKKRTDGGPIYALEAEALRLLGRRGEAVEVAQRGIEGAARAANLARSAELEMVLALIHEAEGELEPALAAAQRARELAAAARQEEMEMRAMVSGHRLQRKLGEAHKAEPAKKGGVPKGKHKKPPEKTGAQKTRGEIRVEVARREAERQHLALRTEIVERADRLSRRDLQRQPVLLRELAAEVGEDRPELLRQSLRYAGLSGSGGEETQAIEVADLLIDLDESFDGDEVARTAGIDPEIERPKAWRKWVEGRGPRVGRSVAELLEQLEISQKGADVLNRQLRQSVDHAISKTFRSRS